MNNQTAIRVIISGFLAVMIGSFFFFGFGNYNNADTNGLPDPNEGNEKVYGKGLDSVPFQTKLEYPENPETAKRAETLRDKMFPKDDSKDLPKVDSTQSETTEETGENITANAEEENTQE